MSQKVSIQGYEGSFHHAAAKSFFGKSTEVIPCATFREVVHAAGKEGNAGLMAIENSIAGSILSNYILLQKSNLSITGEIYLQIRQHLLVNPGVKLDHIREVHSHPMALQQCFQFLDKHHWRLVETEDTALSARHIQQHKSKHIAAIAGSSAAELYGLKILSPNIHSEKSNYTRFLVLEKRIPDSTPEGNKASVHFGTTHQKGSLAKVLTVIAKYGVNLSKLQSAPAPGKVWKYQFHADMEFEDTKQFQQVMKDIRPLTKTATVLGVYKKGKTVRS